MEHVSCNTQTTLIEIGVYSHTKLAIFSIEDRRQRDYDIIEYAKNVVCMCPSQNLPQVVLASLNHLLGSLHNPTAELACMIPSLIYFLIRECSFIIPTGV